MINLDKSTWQRVKFGDVIRSVTDRVNDPAEAGVERYVGLEHLDPGVLTVQRWDDPSKVSAQKLLFEPGDVIFGRRRAYQKKVARADFDGICSAHALVLRAIPDKINPDFLPVFLSSDYFLDRAIEISVGSLSPTVNWRDLKVQEFALPPLKEQKRIADLMWAVERHNQSVEVSIEQTQRAREMLISSALAKMPSTKLVGEFCTIRSGPSYPASSSHAEPVPGSRPVMGITNTLPGGIVDISEVSHVTGLSDSVQTVDSSTLVLIRTNGNRDRIGNVYLPPFGAHGYAVSAFQFLLKAETPSLREYAYVVLGEKKMQSKMSDGASGTTGLGNLGARWLANQQVAWSDEPKEREAVVATSQSLNSAVSSLSDERSSLDLLRSALLSSIFGDA